MAIIGDTVRLKVTFKTFDGRLLNPGAVTLKIYNEGAREPFQTIELSDEANKESEGTYFYDYTVSDGEGNLEFEYTGQLEENVTVVNRETLPRTWKRR
jgi:hypothetical protein